ncbi:MAG: hypothetical protein Q8900_00495 [Bacillota bacterium]|nr:hypothetical protein [Bacillota bacterium]
MLGTLYADEIGFDRLYITKKKKKYFIAVDDGGEKYKILLNSYSKKFSKGYDSYLHYSIVRKGIFYTTVNPISHEDYLKMASTGVNENKLNNSMKDAFLMLNTKKI